MNKFTILCALIVGNSIHTTAQSILDSVSIQNWYSNETWYQLADGTETTAPKNEWDIAFSTDGFSSTIHFNHSNGAKIWSYQNGTNTDWSTIDTTGITNWNQVYNSPTSWEIGAFDQNVNVSSQFDYGWGVYNMSTHFVTGDSLYIVQLASGDYKKLDIINLANGSFNFRFSNLDNSNEETKVFTKADYSTKLFGYYSIENDVFINREPALDSWDLVFKQYIDFVPTPYLVTGIICSPNWTVAKESGIANPSTFVDYSSSTFNEEINTIGYDWKSFNMSTYEYDIVDDVVYFLQNTSGDVWKIIPTGFGGSTTGKFYFSKEKLATAGIENQDKSAFLSIYPNPVSEQFVVTFDSKSTTSELAIYNSLGQLIISESFQSENGLTQKTIFTNELNTGVYFVILVQNGNSLTQKIIKK